MKKQRFIIGLFMLALIWQACKEETDKFWDVNAPAPAQVSSVTATGTPGGAVVSYKIPNDPNMFYVKAVYEIQPGVFREAKSSYYADTLSLVGFGDTLSHEVKIYSVGRNEKMSEPLTLTVKPLTPPVNTVFNTLTLDETFGGVDVTFKNTSRANLAISVIVDTTGLGTWAPVTTYYTGAEEGLIQARGLDTLNRKFGVVIRDHWNNYSDTLVKPLSPLYEQQIPAQGMFKVVKLAGDSWQGAANAPIEELWNGNSNGGDDLFGTANKTDLVQWFTIDLGQTVKFSRMKLWQRVDRPYAAGWIKEFEIYGSNGGDLEDWNSWQKLGYFVSNPPSGSIWPDYTPEDMDYERAGEDYSFPQPSPAVRYIRLKKLNSYGNQPYYGIAELTFWGQIKP